MAPPVSVGTDASSWSAAADAQPDRQFLSEVWYSAWARYLPANGRWSGPLRHLAARDEGGQPLAIMSLAEMRLLPGLRIAALAGPRQPFRGVATNDRLFVEGIEELVRQIAASDLPAIRLASVEGHDLAIDTLVTCLKQCGWAAQQRFVALTLSTRLPATADALYAHLGRKSERKRRQTLSRIKREGGHEIRCHRGSASEDWNAILNEVAEIERKSWLVAKDGDTQFQTEAGRAFWRTVFSDPGTGGAWRLYVLHFAGKPAAYDVCVDSGSTRFNLFGHYDEAYKPLSLGRELDLHILFDALDARLTRVDLGHGDSGYKRHHLGARPGGSLRDVVLAAPTARGRALYAAINTWNMVDEWRKAREATKARDAEPR